MKRTQVQKLSQKIGKKVSVSGWIHTIRVQKEIVFVTLRERTGRIQCIVESSTSVKLYKLAKNLKQETVLSIEGEVCEFQGSLEIHVKKLEVHSQPQAKLPIPVVMKGREETKTKKRFDYRWIDLRKEEKQLIFEIQAYTKFIMAEYLLKKGFIEAMTPKIMASPSESKAELFELTYFGKKAFLAQSGQFYKQMAMAAGLEKFFTFGDTYREDPSSTIWHVAQFTTLDLEISFIKSFEELMHFEEKFLVYVMRRIKAKYGELIEAKFGVKIFVPILPFPKITMKEAMKIVRKKGSEGDVDLSTREEKLLCRYVKKKYGHEFVFLTEFPFEVRPFYHMKKGKYLTQSADLLFKQREIVTTAQREHRYQILVEQVKEKGLMQSELQHYLEYFKYGCPPHGGMGFGFERFIMLLLGLPAIRETMLLPRDMKRLRP